MNDYSLLANALLLPGLMAMLVAVETQYAFRRPTQTLKGRRRTNIALFALFIGLTVFLIIAVALLAAAHGDLSSGYFARLGLGGWSAVAIAVLILDFFSYVAHRLMHLAPALWRFHRVHHSDVFVDATTAFRQHPFESVLRFAFTYGPAILLGVPAAAIVIYRGLSGVFALFEHANLALPTRVDAVLSRIFVTPMTHKIHHSQEPYETDSNFGNILTIFDRLFGTFMSGGRATTITYGLYGFDAPAAHGFGALLNCQFVSLAQAGDAAAPGSAREEMT